MNSEHSSQACSAVQAAPDGVNVLMQVPASLAGTDRQMLTSSTSHSGSSHVGSAHIQNSMHPHSSRQTAICRQPALTRMSSNRSDCFHCTLSGSHCTYSTLGIGVVRITGARSPG